MAKVVLIAKAFHARGVRVLVVFLAMVLLGFVAYTYRLEIGTWWWETTHSAPEVVLLATQNARLGAIMGDYYFDQGYEQREYDIERADKLFTTASQFDPEYPWPLFQRARIAFLQGEYEEAKQYLDVERTLPNAMPRSWYLRGLVEGFAENHTAALGSFLTYYEYDNESWYIHNNLAWTYFKLGQYVEMDLISTTGLVQHPDNPWLLVNRGIAQYNLGRYDESLEFLMNAQRVIDSMDETVWSKTYPGNDPQVAAQGWNEFQTLLQDNIDLVHTAKNEVKFIGI